MTRVYLGFSSFFMAILFTAVVFSIRIYVNLIRHRCKGRTKGFVPVNSDIFRYTVLQNEYVGYLRPCHTKVGHVSVRYNLADYQDAYVVGDWNDLHRMHDFFQILSVAVLLFGWIISVGI